MGKVLPFIIAFFSLIAFQSLAQRKEIKGHVKDMDTNEPLIGMAVFIKGTGLGVSTDLEGNFSLIVGEPLPVTLVISGLGFQQREIFIDNLTPAIQVNLKQVLLNAEEVVITASRMEEAIMTSSVAIEKLTIRDLRESPSPSLFDAIEAVKGVQMTTISMGFKVPNTRGFTNTTNSRFLSMVDGADTQAPGLGVSIANTVGPSELDIESIEIIPGASSAMYGMNALNGTANMVTKNPFLYQGFSLYHKTGLNHIDGADFSPQLFTESAVRYAQADDDRWAFKVNFSYLQGTDWVANSDMELNPSSNLSNDYNPASNPLNSYGNENQNKQQVELADGKRYEIRRTGYFEKDLVNHNYGVENIKFDAALHYKINPSTEASYAYRVGSTDAIFQRGNRIRLDNYQIQQHLLTLKNSNYFIKGYLTAEKTVDSYNLRPMGENLDRAFKSDAQWFSDYAGAYNQNFGGNHTVVQLHQLARATADAGRYEPGTAAFDAKLRELAHSNDWDMGAQLVMQHKFYHLEGQYDFSKYTKVIEVTAGVDYRDFIIQPEGNSFKNPITSDPFATLNYRKIGGFAQVSKRLMDNRLNLITSGRIDKAQYFDLQFNPRIAAVYSLKETHHFRTSLQNGFRFPNLFEGFSTVNNGGIIRFGGLKVMSKDQRLFENSYLRSSVDQFQTAVIADLNSGITREKAVINRANLLIRNEYTYLVPEEITGFDLGYKASLKNNRLYIDLDFYYNQYKNFIDQVEIVVPNTGEIGNNIGEIDPVWFAMENIRDQTRYRMWTNSKSLYENYGLSAGLSYNAYKKLVLSGNYSHAALVKTDNRDKGLETAFNTPAHILNLTLSDREVMTNLGYSLSYRWQSAFDWNSPLANGRVGSYYTLDAQVTVKIPNKTLSIKSGGTNLLNQRYTQYVGGPEIGAFYYIALTFDAMVRK
jgi:iron complex outermembrane recepter protein